VPHKTLPDPYPKSSAEIASAAIDAARKAIAEGNAIVKRAQETYGLKEDPGPSRRRWIPPAPPESEPDYFLSERDRENVHAVTTMMALARATKRPGTRKAAVRAIGQHLERLRDVDGRDCAEWIEILRRECVLGKTRAYEIIRTFGEKSQKTKHSEGQNG
jgi:hypothetical protein